MSSRISFFTSGLTHRTLSVPGMPFSTAQHLITSTSGTTIAMIQDFNDSPWTNTCCTYWLRMLPHADVSCVMPSLFIDNLGSFFWILVITHEDVSTLDAHLTLVVRREVLHLRNIHELDATASHWWSHVFRYVIALHSDANQKLEIRRTN
ncbi:hypothetical protein ALC57_12568 [Trachymyrmex cornetzi]|uniref:Uncharacterized protein n=1 Tax=Trachymyrmex cornetzi TaxID=471704 RepID=A0A151J0X1_9HYME|nr:hypothetical protein ALC57_12568 [Trachymyrmex cornetzi]